MIDLTNKDASLLLDMLLAAQDAGGFVAGMRHRLIHNYAEVDLELVWSVVSEKLALLSAALAPLIPPEDPPKR
jgi:Protein of unknown function DUF86